MTITVYDIARRAGYSHTAVAAVLGGREKKLRIGPESAEHIRRTAERMGYRPNAIAQAFSSGKTNVVGVILSSPRREFLGKIIAGAMAAAWRSGLLLKTLSVEETGCDVRSAIDQCLQHRVAALLCCDVRIRADELLRELAGRTPVCWVNCNRQKIGFAVDPDDHAGAMAAVDHLYELGHRRIAFLAAPSGQVGTVDRRRSGFRAAMRKHRLTIPEGYLAATGPETEPQSIRRAASELLKRADRPTAIIAANDARAAITLQVAGELGIAVPGELSLIGFSDDTLSQYTTPPLTTIRQPHAGIGQLAVEMLSNIIEGRTKLADAPSETLLPVELLVRQSTAAPPTESVNRRTVASL